MARRYYHQPHTESESRLRAFFYPSNNETSAASFISTAMIWTHEVSTTFDFDLTKSHTAWKETTF
jgi:hypothetical protein